MGRSTKPHQFRKPQVGVLVAVIAAIAWTSVVVSPSTAADAPGPVTLSRGDTVTEVVGDDRFVVRPRSVAATESALGGPGQGFLAMSSITGMAQPSYRIKLVSSPNIARFLPAIAFAASELTAITGRQVTVDTSALIAPRDPLAGEVIVRTSTSSPCGPLTGGPRTSGVIGCGGPWTNGLGRITAGELYLQPDFYCSSRVNELVAHELGHAFGLDHYNDLHVGLNQIMRSSVSGTPTYRAGDRLGLSTLSGVAAFSAAGSADASSVRALSTSTAPAATDTGATTAAITDAAVTVPSLFSRPVSATRILDTRIGVGLSGIMQPAQVRTLAIPQTLPGAPFDAVVLNLLATGAQSAGHVTVWPTGTAQPETSVLNFQAGVDGANLVMLRVGSAQSVSIVVAGGPVHLVGDAAGGFSPTGATGLALATPVRLLDTRVGTVAGEPGNPVACGGSVYAGDRVNTAGVPVDAVAELVTVTAVGTNGGGFVSLTSSSVPFGTLPATSTLNVVDGDTRANLAITPSRTWYVRNSDDLSGHLLADLSGSFVPVSGTPGALRFSAADPVRVLDTRIALGLSGAFGAGATRTFNVGLPAGLDPAKITAVVLNLTATATSGTGYVTAFAGGSAQPTTSNLNMVTGRDTAGLAVVTLGPAGSVSLFSSSSTHLLADVMGYFVQP